MRIKLLLLLMSLLNFSAVSAVGNCAFINDWKRQMAIECEASGSETVIEYTLGLSHSVNDMTDLGIEIKGNPGNQMDPNFFSSGEQYFVPGLTINIWDNIKFDLKAAFGLSETSEKFTLKSALTVDL